MAASTTFGVAADDRSDRPSAMGDVRWIGADPRTPTGARPPQERTDGRRRAHNSTMVLERYKGERVVNVPNAVTVGRVICGTRVAWRYYNKPQVRHLWSTGAF